MKTTLVIASLLASTCLTGCKPSEEKSAGAAIESSTQTVEKSAAVTTASAPQSLDYTYAKKADFAAAMRTELAPLNKNLDQLTTSLENASDVVKTQTAPKVAVLREKAAKMEEMLGRVAGATPATWDGIKADCEKAYAALENGLAESRQWASDKVAP